MLYLLFALVLITGLALYVYTKELLFPPVLVCVIYLICIFFCIINIDNWNITFHWNTFILIYVGIITFSITSLISYNIQKKATKKKNKVKSNVNLNIKKICLSNFIFIPLFVVGVILSYLLFREVYRISILGGNTQGIFGMITYYRNYTAYNMNSEDISTFLEMFVQFYRALGFVSIFAIIFNLVNYKKMSYKYLVLLVFSIFNGIIMGGRALIIWQVTFAITCYYILSGIKNNWAKRFNKRMILIGLFGFVGTILVFYGLTSVTRIFNTRGFIEYISIYAGAPIYLFDLYLNDIAMTTNQLGLESFYGIYSTLDKIGLINIKDFYSTNINLEFRWQNGINLGNVYGALRRYYADFGILGIVLLQSIAGFFFGTYYTKMRHGTKPKSYFSIIIFSYLFYHVFEMPIDDNFFKSVFSIVFVAILIMLYVSYCLLIKFSIRNMTIIKNRCEVGTV